MSLFKGRYAVLFAFVLLFLVMSFAVRTALLVWAFHKAGLTLPSIFMVYVKGWIYDTGVAVFFTVAYGLYLLLLPQRWNASWFNRLFTYTGAFLAILVALFSFFAEFTFWAEFESRFNFIAVDYLIYTYEVINNINQSYPLPYLIGGMLMGAALLTWLLHRTGVFRQSFQSETPFRTRALLTVAALAITAFYALVVPNSWTESRGMNRYQQELSKAGIYSFVAAFANNELPYDLFYLQEDEQRAFSLMRNELGNAADSFLYAGNSIYRSVPANGATFRPNVIMVTIESFSADFMTRFGNQDRLTPVLDSLASKSMLFTNMFATGTRTVRGMEALTLAVPPTPGNSIVRRKDNDGLFTVGTIFREAGYDRAFFYGGDGYFDNMNQFFGGNGFDITDRGRKVLMGDHFKARRTIIPDKYVHFENAWGICDEDIYDAVIRQADEKYTAGRPFFNFVMTTSNHRPFTYPEGRIDIPSGSGREGAVKYTDYAIGQFLKKAGKKPWFRNTVFVFVADHCASSAGKNEIELSKYHIPCMFYNLPESAPREIGTLCSQIDIYPTLLHLLNWRYKSNLYGNDVLQAAYRPRALVGTYQKLGFLRNDSLLILSPHEQAACFVWSRKENEQRPVRTGAALVHTGVAYYQTAYKLYKSGGMKERALVK
jgi:phosphoglycerol transferase MdoB-like AlkP superfamily enzyme